MNKELDAIRERCEKATPGPWTVNWSEKECENNHCPHGLDDYGKVCESCEDYTYITGATIPQTKTVEYGDYVDMNDADADFIANARTDIPFLLAEIDRLKDEWDAIVYCKECEFWDKTKPFVNAFACKSWTENVKNPRYTNGHEYCARGRKGCRR